MHSLHILLFAALVLSFNSNATELPHNIKSFTQAKKFASQVYRGHHETFYCGCGYDNKKRVDAASCGYKPRKNAQRGQRIEWEHVVPAHAFGQTRQCWREPICTTKKGKAYKGRRCCEKVDPVFRAMVSDLNNLVPAVGELNGDRSHFNFTMLEGEPRQYGSCDFEVDFKARKAEPRPEVRGDIARTYFYMHYTYGLPISKKQWRLFDVWDRQDPVDEWERERRQRIKLLEVSR